MPSIDPIVLFFLLGLIAGLARSELRLPAAIYDFLSVVLLLAIGLKGGVELSRQSLGVVAPQALAVIPLGLVLPLLAFPVLWKFGRFARADAASIAAHYGSVSVGTYAVAVAFLDRAGVSFEEHIPVFVVVLEMPAILVGVVLARGVSRKTRWGTLAHEVLLGKSIVLLAGGMLIGWVAGSDGVKSIEGLFFQLFGGVLALFLLEMGLIASGQMGALRQYGIFLLVYSVVMPILGALSGCTLGWLIGLSPGGSTLLGVLGGSASYIAVPAAMRIAVPEANPALALSASLGVTFPFNVFLGIPLYLKMAMWIHGVEA